MFSAKSEIDIRNPTPKFLIIRQIIVTKIFFPKKHVVNEHITIRLLEVGVVLLGGQ